jgi:hypothetical protein
VTYSVSREQIAVRLEQLDRRLRAAGGDDIEVVAVTKGFPADVVAAGIAAGCVRIGESYAQELTQKRRDPVLDCALGQASVHFIGRLQTNKVRTLVGVVDVYESVDRASLIDELARRVPGGTVLIQVNATEEPDKGGCQLSEVRSLVDRASAAGLRVDGLMTVGPTTGGPSAAAAPFREVRRLVDHLGLVTCSMGMSDDLEVAVAEGSTRVRVGTALFGGRPGRK